MKAGGSNAAPSTSVPPPFRTDEIVAMARACQLPDEDVRDLLSSSVVSLVGAPHSYMDVNRFRQLLLSSWNVRGLNDPDKCLDVKMNLSTQPLHVICLQETKLSSIPLQKSASFLPPGFSSFSLLPSIGASGGIATAWDSRYVTHLSNRALQFSLSSTFELVEDGVRFTITNIYAPCDRARREDFLSEMRSLSDLDAEACLLVGDFNIARADPTLVRLDRAFINLAWGARLFNSTLHSLVRNTSDHVPLMLTASSRARKSQIFRYEKTWAFSPEYRALVASV
ncbi:hypothetical protein ACQ4PT_051018 [Festuca glaucescens]